MPENYSKLGVFLSFQKTIVVNLAFDTKYKCTFIFIFFNIKKKYKKSQLITKKKKKKKTAILRSKIVCLTKIKYTKNNIGRITK